MFVSADNVSFLEQPNWNNTNLQPHMFDQEIFRVGKKENYGVSSRDVDGDINLCACSHWQMLWSMDIQKYVRFCGSMVVL
jgi:hypothetical protein